MERARIAKVLFFVAAAAAMALSIGLWFSGQREEGLFVGLWVPTILSAGGLAFVKRGGR